MLPRPMVEHPPLRASPAAVLRLSALAAERARPTLVDIDPDDLAAVTEHLRAVAADPVVREAVAVSSPSLMHTLDAVADGRTVEAKKLRRAAVALTRYLLRMTSRATPFGLLAGVSTARFGDTTTVTLGTGHHKAVRPDAGWLAALVRGRLADLDVVRTLQVVLNNLCGVRGDRLVLPYVPVAGDDEQAPRELSVRNSPLVAAVARLARLPIGFPELVAALGAEFPQAPADAVERLLLQLVGRQILLTELAPPPSAVDPIAHVLQRLPGDTELTAARAAQARFAAAPIGEGLAAWREIGATLPHVDLAVDATVTVHRQVAAELESAAAALVRMTPADIRPAGHDRYQLDFIARYGDTQLVPLRELLDATRGMDAPAGYRVPRTTREKQLELRVRRSVERDRLRGTLAQQAVLDGTGEVVLDDPLLDRLAVDDDVPPPEAEFGVEVVAESAAAIDGGDFRLVLWSTLMGLEAGALSGRFAHLLGAPDAADWGEHAAQVEFAPAFERSANVSRVPRLLPRSVPVGVFADPRDDGVVDIDDLAVGADARGLYLWSTRLGAEVVPCALHRLDLRRQVPNTVRFLLDVVMMRRRGLRPWDWGPAGDQLLYLPRVRRGRAVLSAASWRTDPGLADPALPDRDWRERFENWRALWRVPSEVALTVADSRVALDLDAPLHRALLRNEIARQPESFLVERPASGWLDGHAGELVVTLRSAAPQPVRTTATIAPRVRHLPGGEWTSAKLYAPEDLHRRLLAHSVDVLRSRLPASVDRWYFLRYADPQPHLRLRLHGPASEVLPVLHDWAREICAADLAQRLELDTYEPELSRYGGPAVLEAAERAFQADSEAAIALLRISPDLPAELLVAAGAADLAASFGDPQWREWVLRAVPRSEHHTAFQAVRADAIRVITDGEIDPRVRAIWAERAPAVRSYGDAVRGLVGRSPLASLLHLHQIRLAGISPNAEARANAILRGAIEVGVNRARYGR